MKKKIYIKPSIQILIVENEGPILAGSVIKQEVTYKKSELGDYENVEISPSFISDFDF